MSLHLAASLGVLALAAPAAAVPPPADLVLKNAIVHTVDAKRPRAEAVAVRANRIVAVGANADVLPLVGPKTRVLDLAGRTVVPGFDDSHAHMLGIGFARLDVDLVGTRSYAEVVGRVAKAVKTRRSGEWVRGRGWHEGKWDAPAPGAVRGFPTHDALTAVSPHYRRLVLHCDNFNYTPGKEAEDVAQRFAVHYKGQRKQWMLNRSREDCSFRARWIS